MMNVFLGSNRNVGQTHESDIMTGGLATSAPLEPQGAQIFESFKSLADMEGVTLPDDLLSKVEGLTALFFTLRECQSSTQFIASVTLYLKTLTSKSLTETAMTSLQDIFPDLLDSQGSVLDGAPTQPEWLKAFKKIQHNWQLVVMNEGFTKISKLMSLLVGMGMCEASKLECNFKGIRLFQFSAAPRQASAIDLLDAVFGTVNYFVEGGYECIRTGSIDPLLYGDTNLQEFEKLYATCEQGATLARAGNLAMIDMDNSKLDFCFMVALAKVRDMISVCKNTVLRRTLTDRQERLRRLQTAFHETRTCGGLREAPFALGFFGGSGVGKSTIAQIMMVILLHKNGFDASDDKMVTLNESDKYMSNYRSFINGVFIDDIGNTKAEFAEKAPTAKIIELVNNVKAYANMAEADMKGKVSIEPKVVITTKNVKDACAHTYSNEPVSIARREKIVVTVRVKEQFRTNGMLDAAKVELYHEDAYPYDNLIPDLWELDLEFAYPIPNKTKGKPAVIGWQFLEFEGKKMQNVGIEELIKLSANMSVDHYRQQKELVENQTNVEHKMDFCKHCRLPVVMCDKHGNCSESMEAHAGPLVSLLTTRYFGYKFTVANFFKKKFERAELWSVPIVVKHLDWLEESKWTTWTNYVPAKWFEYSLVKSFILTDNSKNIRRSVITRYWILCVLSASDVCMSYHYDWRFIFLILPILLSLASAIEVEKESLYRRIRNESQAMPEAMKRYRDGYAQYITGACTIIAGLYLVSKVWKSIQMTPVPQGNISPTSMKDIEERDEESTRDSKVAAEHNWSTVEIAPIPNTIKSKCTTSAQLEENCFTNLAFFTFEYEGETHGCDAFFIRSNVAILPTHMWKTNEIKAHFARTDESVAGGNFSAHLSKSQSIPIPDTDFSLVWVPNGGSWKDLTEYLPLDNFGSVPATFIHKTRDGKMIRDKLRITPGMVLSQIGQYFGWHYTMSINTRFGFCMSPLVSQTKGPVIAGFHLAGKTGTPTGAAGILLKSQLEVAICKLSYIPGVLLCHSEGTMNTTTYDVQWLTSTSLHEKSPVNRLEPEGTNFKVFGTTIGRASYYSEVEDTPISDAVYDVTGVPNKYGKPKFRKGDPYEESLKYSSRPSIGVEPSLLARAVDDYKSVLFEKLDKFPALKADIKPLTRMQILAGIDAKRFMNKMPPNTSIGHPLGGPKSNHLTRLDPDDFPDHQCPVELNEVFWQEYETAEAAYLRGERYYPVFKTCLKDTPTPMDSDKVRAIQCAPIVLQMFTRGMFLPIARYLSLFPLDSECAVGVNPYGPEWDQMAKHIKKFGDDRILAGDYSKYDLRMPAQATLASFRIMIDIAAYCGYSDRDLKIMRGVATDICYPCVAFNGDLLQFIGTNPSGHNLTVYSNSIVNSLLFRCAYFDTYPEGPAFREICALETYGDDAKGSVKKGYDDFNHISVANYLARHDMKFTMPDKHSAPVPYMNDLDADFLKRKNVYHPDVGYIMGALDEESIFKSLHSVLHSKAVTPQQQCMSNIDGALRDWFNYGREMYEMRREQMQEVASRCDISHGCLMLNTSYDEYLEDWRETYDCQLGPIQERLAMNIESPIVPDYPENSEGNTPLSYIIGWKRARRVELASRKPETAPQA